jgi:hypothetical protein
VQLPQAATPQISSYLHQRIPTQVDASSVKSSVNPGSWSTACSTCSQNYQIITKATFYKYYQSVISRFSVESEFRSAARNVHRQQFLTRLPAYVSSNSCLRQFKQQHENSMKSPVKPGSWSTACLLVRRTRWQSNPAYLAAEKHTLRGVVLLSSVTLVSTVTYYLLRWSLLSLITYYVGQYCHLLRWSVLSLITLVSTVTYYVGHFCHLLHWSVLSLITLVSTVTYYVGQYCHSLRWSFLSVTTLVSTVTYYAGQYCHLLRWSVLSLITLVISVSYYADYYRQNDKPHCCCYNHLHEWS